MTIVPDQPIRFISFSGMDGAGKSTQIENLRTYLAEAGLRVHLITFWDDVATLARLRESAADALFKGDKGVGSRVRPIHRRDKNVTSWYLTGVRFFLYLLDAIWLRVVAARAKRSGTDIVIFDRHVYDELANLDLEYTASRLYARLLLALAPRPDIAYLLDADPDQARERKPEYPLEFLQRIRPTYRLLSEMGRMKVIPPGSVSEVERAIHATLGDSLAIPQLSVYQ